MSKSAVYFTTDAPRDCLRGRETDGYDLHSCTPDHHDRDCPACCGDATWVDRFGDLLDERKRQARTAARVARGPIALVVCRRTHDHDGQHEAVSKLGGYTVTW